MELIEFLKHTGISQSTLIGENAFEEVKHIFQLYEKIIYEYKLANIELPQLILSSSSCKGTLIIEYKGQEYILLDMNESFSYISLIILIIEGRMTKDSLQNLFGVEGLVGSRKREYLEKISNINFQEMAGTFSSLRNYFPLSKLNEIILTFIFYHEFYHYLIKSKKVDLNKQFDIIINEKHNPIGPIIRQLLDFRNLDNQIKEEIVCDYFAFELTWKYIVFEFGNLNPLVLSSLIIFYFKAKKFKSFVEEFIDEVDQYTAHQQGIIEITMQKHIFKFMVLYYVKITQEFLDDDFEVYKRLVDQFEKLLFYCNVVANFFFERLEGFINDNKGKLQNKPLKEFSPISLLYVMNNRYSKEYFNFNLESFDKAVVKREIDNILIFAQEKFEKTPFFDSMSDLIYRNWDSIDVSEILTNYNKSIPKRRAFMLEFKNIISQS